jgi:hypothetical protein
MPKRHIFQQEQAPELAARKQAQEQNQNDIRHDESSCGQGSQEINIPKDYEVFAPTLITKRSITSEPAQR